MPTIQRPSSHHRESAAFDADAALRKASSRGDYPAVSGIALRLYRTLLTHAQRQPDHVGLTVQQLRDSLGAGAGSASTVPRAIRELPGALAYHAGNAVRIKQRTISGVHHYALEFPCACPHCHGTGHA